MVQTLLIRTKLLMALLTLTVSVALMSVTADAANAQVTDIRRVVNLTSNEVYIWNRESGARKHLQPLGTWPENGVQYNEWVPWATNYKEFNRGKYIEVGFVESEQVRCGGVAYCPRYAIWQEAHNRQPYPGNFIRFTWTSQNVSLLYDPNAPPIPGRSTAGGRRDLYIRPVPGHSPSFMSVYLARALET